MSNLLDRLNLPKDIKTLSEEELQELCKEVRDYIILTVLKNGGHLASPLGVVELTTALLFVFDPMSDRILFDVGHQCYAYKILTDRCEKFKTLRRKGGISGFPDPKESVFDKLVAGHAGTALSECIGYSIADKLSGEAHNNIAVLGDGVFANGLTLEALNNVGRFGKQIIIVNDNDFSIDPSVGAYSKRFEKFRGKKTTQIEYGLFDNEDLGYFGCVDGHNLSELISALKLAKSSEKSLILHVKTVKGKGYQKAEDNPVENHSFGQTKGFSSFLGKSILKRAERDEKLVVVVSAMGEGYGLKEFAEKYPERFIDLGIAEGLSVSVASSLARSGYHVIVAIYATFIQRAFDEMLVEASDLPITYLLSRSGIVAGDGETHQGVYVYQTTSSIKNVHIAFPTGVEEADKMLNWGLDKGIPHVIAVPKEEFHSDSENDDFPKWELKKAYDGSNAVIFAVGAESVKNALYVSEMLAYYDIFVDVVNTRYPNIIDSDFVGKYEKVFVVDESYKESGFLSKLSEVLKVERAFVVTSTLTHATKEELLFDQEMSKGKIYMTIKSILSGEEDYED